MRSGITILIAALLAFGWAGCDTANNMEDPNKNGYVRLLGNDFDQHGVDIVVDAADGSMYILGHTGTTALGQQLYVVHTNPDGFVLWEKTYGGFDNEEARDIEILADGDLAILGIVSDANDPLDLSRTFMLWRIHPDGLPRDSIPHGDPGFLEEALSVTEVLSPSGANDGFIVTGSTNNPGVGATGPSDAMFVRFDTNLLPYPGWNDSYGAPPDFDAAVKTVQVGTDFYVFGHTNQAEGGGIVADNILDYNVFVWVLNADGIPGNVYLIGDSLIVGTQPGFDEMASSVALVPTNLGGGYAVSGYSTDPSTNTQRMVTMTIRGDLSGVPVDINTKNKRLLLPDDPRLDDDTRSPLTTSHSASVFVTRGSEFLVLGTENMNGNENIYLKKLNGEGQTLNDAWFAPSFFSFGGIDSDTPGAVAETADGHIMVVGTMYLGEPPNGQTKVLLMKLSPNGKLGE